MGKKGSRGEKGEGCLGNNKWGENEEEVDE